MASLVGQHIAKSEEEVGFWLRKLLGRVGTSLEACPAFVGFQESSSTSPHFHLAELLSNRACVIVGTRRWSPESERWPSTLAYTLSTFWASFCILSALVSFMHLTFQTKEPLTGVIPAPHFPV